MTFSSFAKSNVERDREAFSEYASCRISSRSQCVSDEIEKRRARITSARPPAGHGRRLLHSSPAPLITAPTFAAHCSNDSQREKHAASARARKQKAQPAKCN
eukprot:6185579-Pleurochrysis_carterae.AAC.4